MKKLIVTGILVVFAISAILFSIFKSETGTASWSPDIRVEVEASKHGQLGMGCRDAEYNCHTEMNNYEDPNDFCRSCHSESTPNVEDENFQGFGNSMLKKIGCSGCHMPNVDHELPTPGEHASHAFEIPTTDTSCITSDCHFNKDAGWAQKEWDKAKIHMEK